MLLENRNLQSEKRGENAFSRMRKWLLIFGGWMLAGALFSGHQTVSNYFSPNPVSLQTYYLAQTFSTFFWFLLTPFILWITEHYTPEKPRFFRNLFIFFGLSLLVIFATLLVDTLIFSLISFPPSQMPMSFAESFRWQFFRNFPWKLMTYATVLGIVYGIKYYRKFRERELRTFQLEARLAQARLQVLKMQLHPHFLFNTHNTISELIHQDPRAAEKMLTNLSDLLRLSLDKLEVEEITLLQELEFLKKYLEIEQTRFQDRLHIEMDIAPDTLDAVVPNMVLQPLVENAVKHGIAPLARGGTIQVSAVRENGKLCLCVSDNGVGFPSGNVKQIIKGIGLANTKARLLHLYEKEQSFEIRAENGFSVTLKIPFKNAATNTETNFYGVRSKQYEDPRPRSR